MNRPKNWNYMSASEKEEWAIDTGKKIQNNLIKIKKSLGIEFRVKENNG